MTWNNGRPCLRNDALRFFRANLQHYSLAVWGLRLRFDPPYAGITRFFPAYLFEPVMEYRTYGLTAVWGVVVSAVLPFPIVAALVIGWACISWDRSKYLKTNVGFWRQVVKENGFTWHRSHGRLIEALMREIESRMKAGLEWEEMAQEAFRLQDDVIDQERAQRGPRLNVVSR